MVKFIHIKYILEDIIMILGLSTNRKEICEELFKNYSAAGIKYMEISPSAEEYADVDYSNIKLWAEKYGVTLWSYHLQFYPFDCVEISLPEMQAKTVEIFKKQITDAANIGIKNFIIHPSGEPISLADRANRMAVAKSTLKILADFADTLGCTIAVEDLPRTCLGNCSSEILELISAHPSLRVCFDTNHLLGEDIVEFIRKVGDKIITTHISDYDYTDERHWLPGEGDINWPDVIKALEEIDFNGPLLYEIAFEALPTIERERDLTCEDFAKNFNELILKQAPTPIGVRKENL